MDWCLSYNLFDYLSLIFKYYDKNNKIIEKMITSYDDSDLILLNYLKSDKIKDYKFIFDYFSICSKLNYCIKESIFNQLIELCQNNDKLLKYQTIIKQNYDKLKIYLE